MAVTSRSMVVSRSALEPAGCLHAVIALRAASHSSCAGFAGIGDGAEAFGGEYAVQALPRLQDCCALAATSRGNSGGAGSPGYPVVW